MKILRQPSTDEGTFGEWVNDDGSHLCYTVERQETGDHPRIADGTYTFNSFQSPTKGNVWLRDDEAANDGRSMIEIHAANWATQLLGCVAVGDDIESIEGVRGVTNSKNTLAKLKQELPDSFQLTFQSVNA